MTFNPSPKSTSWQLLSLKSTSWHYSLPSPRAGTTQKVHELARVIPQAGSNQKSTSWHYIKVHELAKPDGQIRRASPEVGALASPVTKSPQAGTSPRAGTGKSTSWFQSPKVGALASPVTEKSTSWQKVHKLAPKSTSWHKSPQAGTKVHKLAQKSTSWHQVHKLAPKSTSWRKSPQAGTFTRASVCVTSHVAFHVNILRRVHVNMFD